jgi:hypothetical protein
VHEPVEPAAVPPDVEEAHEIGRTGSHPPEEALQRRSDLPDAAIGQTGGVEPEDLDVVRTVEAVKELQRIGREVVPVEGGVEMIEVLLQPTGS